MVAWFWWIIKQHWPWKQLIHYSFFYRFLFIIVHCSVAMVLWRACCMFSFTIKLSLVHLSVHTFCKRRVQRTFRFRIIFRVQRLSIKTINWKKKWLVIINFVNAILFANVSCAFVPFVHFSNEWILGVSSSWFSYLDTKSVKATARQCVWLQHLKARFKQRVFNCLFWTHPAMNLALRQ